MNPSASFQGADPVAAGGGINAVGTVLLPSVPMDPTTSGGGVSNNTAAGLYASMTALDANTLASVDGVLQGLPTVSSMANGGYGFLGQVIDSAQSAQATNTANENAFVTQNVTTLVPIMQSMANLVGRNQAATINAAANAGSNSGKK